MARSDFSFKDSKELALVLSVKHSDLMDYYWHLDNQIVFRRGLIKCCLVIVDDKTSYLTEMSDPLIFAFFIRFGEKYSIMTNNF